MASADWAPTIGALLNGKQRRFVSLNAQANHCIEGEALAMLVDKAIDCPHAEHPDDSSLHWQLEYTEQIDCYPAWLAASAVARRRAVHDGVDRSLRATYACLRSGL